MNIPVQRNAPSAKSLMSAFNIDKDTAEKVRLTIKSLRTSHGAVSQIAKNGWVGGYGAETIYTHKLFICYVNMGETYAITLIAHKNRVFIGNWGDLVEKYDRN